jgi:hypothetical protein
MKYYFGVQSGKIQRTGEQPGGITSLLALRHILHLATKNRFSFTRVMKYFVHNVMDQGTTPPI